MTRKTAAIFHGTGISSQSFWIPWLKQKLETEGYDVWTPDLPDTGQYADLELWVKTVTETAPHAHFDLMIGHSAGVPLIGRLLSHNKFTANHALFVAGFINPLPDMTEDNPAFPRGLDYDAIRKNGKYFTSIHSDNDPWGCDIQQGEAMRQAFGGTLIICTGQGHFGSRTYEQPYKEFPLLLNQCMMPYE